MLLNYPCNNHTVSLDYGHDATNDPLISDFYKVFDNKHPGVDFDLPEGTDVLASFEGIVVRCENHKGMGNTIGIRNGNILALYAHLSEILVKLGEKVKAGSLIGKSGNTGTATTSPHLHFELRDLRFKELKEMVFKPEFEKEIQNYKFTFIYKVNNTSSKKNLVKLATLYFGNPDYKFKIKDENKLKFNTKDELPQDLEVIIPNYWNPIILRI